MSNLLKYKNALIILLMLFVSGQSLAQYIVQAVYPVKSPGCNRGLAISAVCIPLHTRKLSVLDGWGETGIDAIFKRGDEYFIVEAKYGTAKFNPANPSTNLPRQMTDAWIKGSDRIFKAVGGDRALADEISKKYGRLVAHISPDGTVVYDEIDGATKIIGSFP
ncbi:MAG: hypothetical protein KA109_04225 [Saprospiraceae bacterium]|nr:hypothetical protein [Saprospiraceae bacterium]MBK8513973.1 hypothetical protein [Saprospiraceae bacterium]MBP7800809.1 hypothetical protein [Saprospiraceae bacterium]